MVGERVRVRVRVGGGGVVVARECLGTTIEKGFEVFDGDFRVWHKPSTRNVWYSVKIPSV